MNMGAIIKPKISWFKHKQNKTYKEWPKVLLYHITIINKQLKIKVAIQILKNKQTVKNSRNYY